MLYLTNDMLVSAALFDCIFSLAPAFSVWLLQVNLRRPDRNFQVLFALGVL